MKVTNEGRISKWISNDRNVMSTIPQTDRATSVLELDTDDLPIECTLGIMWNVQSDTLGFKVNIREKPITRRGILSTVSPLYDPLGFLAPFVLPAKALLQSLCRQGLDWDNPNEEN